MCGGAVEVSLAACPFCGEGLTPLLDQRLAPHRGGLILALGILSWFLCAPMGIAAWIMGSSDLAEMDAGRMDPEGRNSTQMGRIFGLIFFVLNVVALVAFIGLYFLQFLFGVRPF